MCKDNFHADSSFDLFANINLRCLPYQMQGNAELLTFSSPTGETVCFLPVLPDFGEFFRHWRLWYCWKMNCRGHFNTAPLVANT